MALSSWNVHPDLDDSSHAATLGKKYGSTLGCVMNWIVSGAFVTCLLQGSRYYASTSIRLFTCERTESRWRPSRSRLRQCHARHLLRAAFLPLVFAVLARSLRRDGFIFGKPNDANYIKKILVSVKTTSLYKIIFGNPEVLFNARASSRRNKIFRFGFKFMLFT